MLTLKKVAVTGGLSAGKTTVCRIFEALGAYVVSADEVVHCLLSFGSPAYNQVIDLLGMGILSNNRIDKKKVADLVFSQPQKLAALEVILHPLVLDEIERCYQQIGQEKQCSLFVVEIPLLYETKQEDRFDIIISVFSEEYLCRDRFARQRSNEPGEFDLRMKRQLSPSFKTDRSHYTIYNNGSLDALQGQVKALYSQITQA